jgi:hypothetical protein
MHSVAAWVPPKQLAPVASRLGVRGCPIQRHQSCTSRHLMVTARWRLLCDSEMLCVQSRLLTHGQWLSAQNRRSQKPQKPPKLRACGTGALSCLLLSSPCCLWQGTRPVDKCIDALCVREGSSACKTMRERGRAREAQEWTVNGRQRTKQRTMHAFHARACGACSLHPSSSLQHKCTNTSTHKRSA